jgi:hypothetical protein
VAFHHRRDEWAAQATSSAVRYDIWLDPVRGRWYLDASWRLPPPEAPSLEVLRQHYTLAVDLNADHLAGWVLDPSGNPLGAPVTIPLDLAGQPTPTRHGRLRQAVAALVRLAIASGCRSLTVEDLDFAGAARWAGRRSVAGDAADAFAAWSRGSPPGRSESCW